MKTVAATFAAFVLAHAALATTPPVPRPAKELTIDLGGGQQRLLSQYRGKVVVIQFLFTTCPHCQAMSKVLTQLQQQLGPKGVQMLGVAFDDDANPGSASNYTRQFGVQFPVGFAKRDTVLSYLGVSVMDRLMVPQMMVVDKKGVVRAQSEPSGSPQLQDGAYLTKFINDLLTEGTSASKGTVPAAKTGSSGTAAPAAKGGKS